MENRERFGNKEAKTAGRRKQARRILAVLLAVLMVLPLLIPTEVQAAGKKPVITTQPTDKEAKLGKKAVFTVAAEGEGLNYQWYIKLKDSAKWKRLIVSTAKKATLRLTTKEAHDGALIRCRVSNSAGHVYSKTVTLKVTGTGGSDGKTTKVKLNMKWKYAEEAAIHSGAAVLYKATKNRRGITVAVNAGHGTKGGYSAKTWSHPDHSKKVTGGSAGAGAYKAYAVTSGMEFNDGTAEATITLKVAKYLKDMLLAEGFDVLMLRDSADVQLDNVARTVIANNKADCHIAIHYDGDGLSYDKGAYYMSVPSALKKMSPVSANWKKHEALGSTLMKGLKSCGYKVWKDGPLDMDLTQTSYSTIPSVVIEMGNQCSSHSESACKAAAKALLAGIKLYYKKK